MDEASLTKLAEDLARQAAADDQTLAHVDEVLEFVRLALSKVRGVNALELQMLETMAVMRAAGRTKVDAARELLRLVDEQRPGAAPE